MKIIPSIMAQNQQELGRLLKKYHSFKELHLDVVDGKFAANHSLDFKFKLSKKKYSAHLMIKNPENWIKKYGHLIDLCIVQASEIKDKKKYIVWIKKQRKKVGLALKPNEPVGLIKPYLQEIDYVLILTVEPGFYGSKYLKKPLAKIKEIKKVNPQVKIIVDGGMNPSTIKDVQGADIVVVGSYLAKAGDARKAMREMGG